MKRRSHVATVKTACAEGSQIGRSAYMNTRSITHRKSLQHLRIVLKKFQSRHKALCPRGTKTCKMPLNVLEKEAIRFHMWSLLNMVLKRNDRITICFSLGAPWMSCIKSGRMVTCTSVMCL